MTQTLPLDEDIDLALTDEPPTTPDRLPVLPARRPYPHVPAPARGGLSDDARDLLTLVAYLVALVVVGAAGLLLGQVTW